MKHITLKISNIRLKQNLFHVFSFMHYYISDTREENAHSDKKIASLISRGSINKKKT